MHDAIVKRLNERAARYTIHEHVDSRTFADAVGCALFVDHWSRLHPNQINIKM